VPLVGAGGGAADAGGDFAPGGLGEGGDRGMSGNRPGAHADKIVRFSLDAVEFTDNPTISGTFTIDETTPVRTTTSSLPASTRNITAWITAVRSISE